MGLFESGRSPKWPVPKRSVLKKCQTAVYSRLFLTFKVADVVKSSF